MEVSNCLKGMVYAVKPIVENAKKKKGGVVWCRNNCFGVYRVVD